MRRRPPRSTRTDTLVPSTTLVRSVRPVHLVAGAGAGARRLRARARPLDSPPSAALKSPATSEPPDAGDNTTSKGETTDAQLFAGGTDRKSTRLNSSH